MEFDNLEKYIIDTVTYQLEDRAQDLCKEISQRFIDKYVSLLDRFYSFQEYPRSYKPTYNLYGSYKKYMNQNKKYGKYYCGILIAPIHMHDYPIDIHRKKAISAERLLYKYIYREEDVSATFHGGDYSGGYGQLASFSFYDEMNKFKEKIVSEY